MKKINLWLLLSLFVAAIAMTACSSSDDASGGGGGGDIPVPVPTSITISGVVTSAGSPVSGVKVTAGAASVVTGFNGIFTLEQVSGSVVKFEKDGFATITRAFSAENNYFDVSMTSVRTETRSATSAQTVDVGYSGMKVDLPASYTDVNGNAYNGTNVTIKSAYLDPDDSDFADAMPGNLAAIRTDQSEAELISYGMITCELTGDNGEKLQPGAPAKLTFPVPTNAKKIDGQLPATMPLWSFNEATGLWEEEGIAELNDAGTEYVGYVTHFSWHNLDYPSSRATLNVKVVDANGAPISNIVVNYDDQRKVYTNAQGIATCTVPSNTPMVISIPSESYCDYAAEIDQYGYKVVDKNKIVKQEGVSLNAGATQTITLTMPASSVISGKITNESGAPISTAVWIAYGKTTTSSVVSNKNGEYSIYAPYGYTGTAKIVVFCGDGYQETKEVTLTGADQTVDVVVNGSSTSEAGYVYVKGEGMNRKFDLGVPETGIFEDAVSVYEGQMTINIWSQAPSTPGVGHMDFYITIPEYDESKTSFMGTLMLRWAVWTTYSEDWYHVSSSKLNVKEEVPTYIPIEVVKNSDIYTIKIDNVDGFYGVETHEETESTEIPVKITTTFSAK